MAKLHKNTRGVKIENDMIKYNATAHNRYEVHLPKDMRMEQLDDLSLL